MMLGEPCDDPYVERISEGVSEMQREVRQIGRKLKTPPISSTTRRWVEEKWQYYNRHPECLPGDVARRRVCARDVWAVIATEAREKHNIADFAAFRQILANIRQTRHRQALRILTYNYN